MRTLREFATSEVPAGSQISVRSLGQKYGLSPVISLRTLLSRMYSARFSSTGLAALDGTAKVVVDWDGSVRWFGDAHDSGADGYDFRVSALLRPNSGFEVGFDNKAIALVHSGHVAGTLSLSGSRDYKWDEKIALQAGGTLSSFECAHFEVHLDYDSHILSTFESVASFIFKATVGSAVGWQIGAILLVGVSVASLFPQTLLVPGARIVGGVLWLAGPANTMYALIAEGIASLGSRTREIWPEEYNWANDNVFKGSLPPRDMLVLTDTLRGGDRAFTFPRFDGKITLNMGPESFDNPRLYDEAHFNFDGKSAVFIKKVKKIIYGRTFIHELVHACQIYHSKIDASLLADALSNTACEVAGSDPYLYANAGFDYTKLNLEQQAQIVSDWFVGFGKSGNHTGKADSPSPMDESSPYFRYIVENVRTGNF
jgi:hypothetical protein